MRKHLCQFCTNLHIVHSVSTDTQSPFWRLAETVFAGDWRRHLLQKDNNDFEEREARVEVDKYAVVIYKSSIHKASYFHTFRFSSQ